MLNCQAEKFYGLLIFIASLSLLGCGGSSPSSSGSGGGGGGGGGAATITIATAPASIGAGANWQYSASVSSGSQNVVWSASAGTIDASTGLYIAPNSVPSPAAVTITAASPSTTAKTTATVTVTPSDPLGTVSSYTVFPQPNSCPSTAGDLGGATCIQLAISCPGVADFSTYLKVYDPSSGSPAGTVLFGTGTGGSGLYEDPTAGGYVDGMPVVSSILSSGYNAVEVSFGAPFDSGSTPRGWLTGPGGVRRLACRYATAADWVYNNPTIINPSVSGKSNSAPMCATGNSGGSAAIAYAVYNYGLDSEFAMIEPTSGPVMSRIDQGCSQCSSSVTGPVCANATNPHPQMCYETADAGVIDEAYQATGASSPTPCTDSLNGSPGTDAAALFASDSILYQGSAPISLHTTINQLFGDDDPTNAVPQGMVWQQTVSPHPSMQCLAGVQHDLPSYSSGAMQVANDIVSACHL